METISLEILNGSLEGDRSCDKVVGSANLLFLWIALFDLFGVVTKGTVNMDHDNMCSDHVQ